MRIGLVSALVAVILALPTTALATLCSSQLSFDGAAVVLEGVAQPGPSTPDGTLTSPATFEVLRYVKGTGPSNVDVHTGTTVENGMTQVIVGSIAPRAGETWRILATADTDLNEPIPTVCTQSVRADGAALAGHDVVDSSGDSRTEASVARWVWILIAVPLAISGIAWRRRLESGAPRHP